MRVQSIYDPAFSYYGKALVGYDFSDLINALDSERNPGAGVIYEPRQKRLETLSVFNQLQDRQYGGMPIQIGCCIGTNTALAVLEYHRSSECHVYATDTILLLGKLQDVSAGKYDLAKIEAFFAPAGAAVELYGTTLHCAPCDAREGAGFRVAIILHRYTNMEKPVIKICNEEDKLLVARNKWLITPVGTLDALQYPYQR